MLQRMEESSLSHDDDINYIYKCIQKAIDFAIRDLDKIDRVLSSKQSKDRFCERFAERTYEMLKEKIENIYIVNDFTNNLCQEFSSQKDYIIFCIDGINNFHCGNNALGFIFFIKRDNQTKFIIFNIVKHEVVFCVDNTFFKILGPSNSRKIFSRKIYNEFAGIALLKDNKVSCVKRIINKIPDTELMLNMNNTSYIALSDFLLGKIKYLIINKNDIESNILLKSFVNTLTYRDEYHFLNEYIIFV